MFETTTAALTLIVFLVPGYVWRTVEAQFVYLDKRLEWERFALGLLARSTAVYSLFAFPLYRAWQNKWLVDHPAKATLLVVLLIGLLPVLLGFMAGIIRQRQWIIRLIRWMGLRTFEQHQIPTAWDYLFSKITPRWAIITLREGAKLYNYVGPESYFSSDSEARDLFLSEVIRLAPNGTMEAVPGTAGVYINKDEVVLIEFIRQ